MEVEATLDTAAAAAARKEVDPLVHQAVRAAELPVELAHPVEVVDPVVQLARQVEVVDPVVYLVQAVAAAPVQAAVVAPVVGLAVVRVADLVVDRHVDHLTEDVGQIFCFHFSLDRTRVAHLVKNNKL